MFFFNKLSAVNRKIYKYLNLRKGWNTNRKIVVFESDDWGGLRMPSRSVLNLLLKNGVKLFPDAGYDKYDTLESNNDIERLMDVLYSVQDKEHRPALFTLNTVMCNPNFRKIEESGFTSYYYENFYETLSKYENRKNVIYYIKQGIANKLFKPQFHAREHLNVTMWMNMLRNSIPDVKLAFKNEVFSLYINKDLDTRERFLDAYNVICKHDYDFVIKSLHDGLKIFSDTFGYDSLSMIAPNYLWDNLIAEESSKLGVRYLQGTTFQRYSHYYSEVTNRSGQWHYLGERNQFDQIHLIRNCFFEPSNNKFLNSESCLKEVNNAFKLGKPAIISTHRLNYVGSLDVKKRDDNLIELGNLLKTIKRKFPDVEFLSSDNLGNIISNNQ